MQPGSRRTASGTCSLSYQRLNSASRSGSTVARTLKRCSGNMSPLLRDESQHSPILEERFGLGPDAGNDPDPQRVEESLHGLRALDDLDLGPEVVRSIELASRAHRRA